MDFWGDSYSLDRAGGESILVRGSNMSKKHRELEAHELHIRRPFIFTHVEGTENSSFWLEGKEWSVAGRNMAGNLFWGHLVEGLGFRLGHSHLMWQLGSLWVWNHEWQCEWKGKDGDERYLELKCRELIVRVEVGGVKVRVTDTPGV